MLKPLYNSKISLFKIFFIVLTLTFQNGIAQIGIGLPAGQDPEATLDVGFDNTVAPGFLMPRVNNLPEATNESPITEGMLVYYSGDDSSLVNSYYVYIDGEWKTLAETAGIVLPDTSCVAGITNNSGATELNCNTTEISLTGTGGDNYSWSDGTNIVSSSAGFTVSSPGTYTLTITTESGCTDTASIVITQDITAPTAVITNNTGTTELTSEVTEIVVEASGGETYLWDTGETTAQLTITEADTYTVTVTAVNGCTDTESIVITEEAACETTINEASFENGQDGWNFNWPSSISQNEASDGSSSAMLERNWWWGWWNGVISLENLDLSVYSSITVNFNYKTVEFDGNSEKVYLSFGYGNNYETQEFQRSNDGFTQASYTYSGPNIDQFDEILFWTDMDRSDEKVYIDEIVITGTCD